MRYGPPFGRTNGNYISRLQQAGNSSDKSASIENGAAVIHERGSSVQAFSLRVALFISIPKVLVTENPPMQCRKFPSPNLQREPARKLGMEQPFLQIASESELCLNPTSSATSCDCVRGRERLHSIGQQIEAEEVENTDFGQSTA